MNLIPKYVLPQEDRLGFSAQWFYEGDVHFMAYKFIFSSFEDNSKGANSNVSHTKDNIFYGEISWIILKDCQNAPTNGLVWSINACCHVKDVKAQIEVTKNGSQYVVDDKSIASCNLGGKSIKTIIGNTWGAEKELGIKEE